MKTIKICEKIMEMHKIKKIFIFCICKMLKISAETYAKNCIYNIIDKKNFMAKKQRYK